MTSKRIKWTCSDLAEKLNFYSTLKTDVSRSEYLDLIKNEKHCQAVAKLWSSNHKLRIKNDRYQLFLKFLRNLEYAPVLLAE